MTKSMKKTTVFAAFAAAALLAAGIGVSSPVKASAEDMVVGGVATSGFTMTDGASLKAVNGEFGIRWETNVSADFQSYLAENYAGATITYKTLVTGVNMLEGGDITAVTPDLKKPGTEEAACADLKGTLSEGKYEGRIIYGAENPEEFEAIKDAAVRAELIARAYVEIKTESGVEIIYAQAEDTTRAMQGVAVKALDGSNATDKAIAGEYVNGLANLREKQTKTVYYHYADGDKKNTMEVKDLPNGTYDAYVGAKKVGSGTVVDGVASGLDKMHVAKWSDQKEETIVTQKEHTIYFVNENDDGYLVDFINPTKIIMEAADLDVFKPVETGSFTLRGYYVLGQDIDATGYNNNYYKHSTNSTAQTAKATGFLGTFDGLGHTIDKLVANTGGIFGDIGWSGVVKNVALTNAKATTWSSTQFSTTADTAADRQLLANCIYKSATVENVYIQIANINGGGNQDAAGAVAYSISGRANLKNVVIVQTVNGANWGWSLCRNHARESEDTYVRDGVTLNQIGWSDVHILSKSQEIDGNQHAIGCNVEGTAVKFAGLFEYRGADAAAVIDSFKTQYADVNSSVRASIDTFDSAYWSVVDNVITWGAAAES